MSVDPALSHTKLKFELNTGDSIPAIGLGTWQSEPGQVRDAVRIALQNGYRHIDTALAYGNEKEVGQGIKDSKVPREEIWVTTKLNNPWHKRVPEGIDQSLKDLGLDYVDLYLIHWPCSTNPDDEDHVLKDWDYVKTWIEMQKLAGTGKVKNLGVSNFAPKHIKALEAHPEFKITPAVNQIELHPNCPSPKYLDYFKSKGIHLTAYSPLGSTNSPLNKHKELNALAESKGKSLAQVLLMWGIQRGTSVVPKSVTESRIKANFEIDGWELSKAEMAKIDGLTERFKVCTDDWLPKDADRVFLGDDE